MPDVKDDNKYINALNYLRNEQFLAFLQAGTWPVSSVTDKTKLALQALQWRYNFAKTDDPERVRREGLSYHLQDELKRIHVAEDLVRRVAPGPFENANYLALLAYEAASLELVLSDLIGDKQAQERPLRFLLGTRLTRELDACSLTKSIDDYTVVFLNSGLIEFVYQAAKAVIEAMNPVFSADGRVHSDKNITEISAGLKKNKAPIERVWKTLEAFFFGGYPRAYSKETVHEEYLMPISSLISMAERWVVAHEYGHGLLEGWNPTAMNSPGEGGSGIPGPQNPSWAKEFFADTNATILTVLSAARLDGLTPEFSLPGGIFTLKCIDIRRKAFAVITTGQESIDTGSDTHPPLITRAHQTLVCLRQFFDVEYHKGGSFDLKLILRKRPPLDHPFTDEYKSRFYFFANVLDEIWIQVKPKLVSCFQDKRPLNSMFNVDRQSPAASKARNLEGGRMMAKPEMVLDGTMKVREALIRLAGYADDLDVSIKATIDNRTSTFIRKVGEIRALPAGLADRSLQEVLSGGEGYCMKCRAKRRMIQSIHISSETGKPVTSGVCSVCGTKMFRIGAKPPAPAPEVYGLAGPDEVPRANMSLPPGTIRGGVSPAAHPEPLQVYPHLKFPDNVKPKAEFEITIGLGLKAQPKTVGGSFPVPTNDEEFDLDVHVIAHDFLAPEGTRRYLHVIRKDIQAAKVTVKLIAPNTPTLLEVDLEVEYAYQGNLLGKAWRTIRVVPENVPVPAEELPQGQTPIVSTDPQATPDLTVTISDRGGKSYLEWNFYSPHQCQIPEKQVRIKYTESKAEDFAEENIRAISNYRGNAFLDDQIRNSSEAISDYMPPAFWNVLKQVWEKVKEGNPQQIPTVLIISSDPYIPWELASTGAKYITQSLINPSWPPILGAQLKVGRWILKGPNKEKKDSPPKCLPETNIEIERMALLIGNYHSNSGIQPLPEARKEGEELKNSYQLIQVPGTPNQVDALLDYKYPEDGNPEPLQVLHFACHGEINPGTPDNGIVLDDGTHLNGMILKDRDLLKKCQPLVFMNACEVGSGSKTLTSYGGVAGECVNGGCRGFIAPLWSVDDKVAREFAIDFYKNTVGKNTEVSEVLRDLRSKFDFKAKPPESTYLAYIFYGHPKLVLKK